MLETFNAFVTKINGFVWGPVMLILLVGTHVYLEQESFREKPLQRLSFPLHRIRRQAVTYRASVRWQQHLRLPLVPVIS